VKFLFEDLGIIDGLLIVDFEQILRKKMIGIGEFIC